MKQLQTPEQVGKKDTMKQLINKIYKIIKLKLIRYLIIQTKVYNSRLMRKTRHLNNKTRLTIIHMLLRASQCNWRKVVRCPAFNFDRFIYDMDCLEFYGPVLKCWGPLTLKLLCKTCFIVMGTPCSSSRFAFSVRSLR